MSNAVQTSACVAHKLLRIFKETATSVACPAFIASTNGPFYTTKVAEFVSFFVAIANCARELLVFDCASLAMIDWGCIISNTQSCQIREAQTFRTIVALPYFELCVLSNRVLAFAAS